MTVRIIHGDCRDVLKTLPDESVHCVVTSPPYWGLRDYGTAKWDGGSEDCDHLRPALGGIKASTLNAKRDENGWLAQDGHSQPNRQAYAGECGKCGARRIDQQLGLENSPSAFVDALVDVFGELRRILRADGTAWLNLGDSYTGSGKGGNPEEGKQATNKGSQSIGVLYGKTAETAREAALTNVSRRWTTEQGMAPKNLVGIPWRVAFALQADGWYLRQDIIWAKKNPMPESVTDRCTKAHEYIFMLSKRERYYYDQDAIKEPAIMALSEPDANGSTINGGAYGRHVLNEAIPAKERRTDKQRGHSRRHAGFNDRWDAMEKSEQCGGMRNKRSVWEVATHPYAEAHFATFPPKLIEPCVLAGCPVGGMVLDPFGGAGTTGLVADRHHRNAILIELNPEYAAMAERRIRGDAPLFAEVQT